MSAQAVSFDREGRELFGWYHAPSTAARTRNCVVVLCNPLGYEAICTHRHYRVLAEKLSNSGFAVLRFDYHGTGDSTGVDSDRRRVQAWLNGIVHAIAYAQKLSGAAEVSLFGVRMGATLAMTAAAASQTVQSCVLWAPFDSGRRYVREMRLLATMNDADPARSGIKHDAGADLGEEAAGYLLTHATLEALEQISPVTTPKPVAPRVLLAGRDDLTESPKLLKHLQASCAQLEHRILPGYAGMMLDTFDSVVPEQALDEVLVWLESVHPPQPMATQPELAGPAVLHPSNQVGSAKIRESAVRFGPDNRLFGMITQPCEGDGDRVTTAVLMVTVGSNHRVGPNRMYVNHARVAASLGFMALRMDIGGVGDSPPADGEFENTVYGKQAVNDLRRAMDLLQAQFRIENFVLLGLCSGAYQALHTALADTRVRSLVLINQQVFNWREGDSLNIKLRASARSMSYYRKALMQRGTWTRALRGEINWRVVVPEVSKVLERRYRTRMAQSMGAKPETDHIDVLAAFKQLLARKVEMLMIYSSNDGGINELEAHLGTNARKLGTCPNFNMVLVQGADHTFTPVWSQNHLQELVSSHLIRNFA